MLFSCYNESWIILLIFYVRQIAYTLEMEKQNYLRLWLKCDLKADR